MAKLIYNAECKFCSEEFKVYGSDLANAYGGFGSGGGGFGGGGFVDKVNTDLGTTHVGKKGYILPLYPAMARFGYLFKPGSSTGAITSRFPCGFYASGTVSNIVSDTTAGECKVAYGSDSSIIWVNGTGVKLYSPPVDMKITTIVSLDIVGSAGAVVQGNLDGVSFSAGAEVYLPVIDFSVKRWGSINTFGSVSSTAYMICEPISYAIDDFTAPVGGAGSRSGAFSGNFGYYGDNGELIVGETVKLVDETNNKVFNPVTNTTHNVTDWTYDYSNRSYNVTTDTGDTVTVSYGDENVTIKEGDVTYNVYYVTDGSGGSGGTDPDEPDPPETCKHTYEATVITEPTCLASGSRSLTCSKCNHTKTEKVPATGHIWVVSRTVQTSYDDQGVMVQQGYTIYQCSVCGEQYKDADGAGPPGGSGGTEEKESFWDKVKNFFGSITGGIFDLIVDLVGSILDGLTSLVNKITEKLGVIIDAALKIFAEIPKIFQGFIDFLTAGFAFFPPEIVMIIEFGLLAIVAVAIIKIFL